MTAPKPPGGAYWRAALFTQISIDAAATLVMEATLWPTVDLPLSVAASLGAGTPADITLNANAYIVMRAMPAIETEVNLAATAGMRMSFETPVGLDAAASLVVTASPVGIGNQINTAVQRSATI